MIDASTDIGLNEPGVRNYDDVSEILPFDQMLRTRVAFQADSDRDPGGAHRRASRRSAVRPGGGTISGEIPVMNLDGWTWEENDAASGGRARAELPGRRRRARRRRRRRGARAGGAAPIRSKTLNQLLERARVYAKQPATAAGRLDARAVPAGARSAAGALRRGRTPSRRIRDAVAWAEQQGVRHRAAAPAPTCSASPAFLKQHDVPVILTSVLSLPPREDEFHAYPYQTPGVLAKAGVPFAFSSGGFQFSRDVPFQAGTRRGMGPVARGRASRR